MTMRLFMCVIISIIYFFEIKVISSMVLNKDQSFHVCVNNESIAMNFLTTKDKTCQCQCKIEPMDDPLDSSLSDNGYTYTPGIGSHKLHTYAKTWNEARKICNMENAHLAIVNSKAEETVLVKMLTQESDNIVGDSDDIKQAYLGIHDMYFEDEWVTLFGESLYTTGYIKWSKDYGGQPNNLDGNQNCGTLYLSGGMNDIDCTMKKAFFCERPIPC